MTTITNYISLCDIGFSNINIDWFILTRRILVGQLGIAFKFLTLIIEVNKS